MLLCIKIKTLLMHNPNLLQSTFKSIYLNVCNYKKNIVLYGYAAFAETADVQLQHVYTAWRVIS